MRAGAAMIALLTVDQLGRLIRETPISRPQGWLVAVGLICGNPYFLPLGVMVYTDMIALFFLLLATRALYRPSLIGLAIGCAGMLLCRQYLAFLVLAFLMMLGWRWICLPAQRRSTISMSLAVAIGCLPFAWLLWLWGGMAPANEMQQLYLNARQSYHPNSLILYCSLLTWFCLPAVIACRSSLICTRQALLVIFLLSQVYWCFPVRPSPVAVENSLLTVGLMHRAMNLLEPSGALADCVYYFGFLISLTILWGVAQRAAAVIRQGRFAIHLLPACAFTCFLLVMPWSYLHWEKYFLPAATFALLMIFSLEPLRPRLDQFCKSFSQ
jgi:hypothetical protein